MSNVAPEPYESLARDGGYPQEYEAATKTIASLADAGVKLVAGGDYGHVWQPHGQSACDLQHFVDRAGLSPYQALLTGTRDFAGLTGLEIGELRPGAIADFLIVEGNPAVDVSVLTEPGRRRAVVKGGDLVWVDHALFGHLPGKA
jgi:imidazolonepropionase-like amidohydrolase